MHQFLTASFLFVSLCAYVNAEEAPIQNSTTPKAVAENQNQGTANEVLSFFKFKSNGPAKFKVTPETIKILEKHLKNSDEIVIDADGAIKIRNNISGATDLQRKCMALFVDLFKMEPKVLSNQGVPIFVSKEGKVVHPDNAFFKVTAETVKIFQDLKEGDVISMNLLDEFRLLKTDKKTEAKPMK